MGLKDKPRISNQCCSAVEKLAISTESSNGDEQMNPLTPYFKDIVQVMVVNAQREDFQGTGVDLSQASYVALTALVQGGCSASNDVVYQLMVEILKMLEQTLNPALMNITKANHLQDCLCGLL